MSLADDLRNQMAQPNLTQFRQWLDADGRRQRTFVVVTQPWGEEQWMPLHLAAAHGHSEAVEELLKRGVQPDCRTRHLTPLHARQTPLHLVAAGEAADDAALDIARQLLAAGAEVLVRDAQQRTPLWLAARHHRPGLVSLLADAGSPADTRDVQQRTPLHATLLSPAEGSPETDPLPTVEALLQFDVDVNATCPKEAEGFTPLHRAASRGLGAGPLITRLLQAGADPTLVDPRFGRTAADLADASVRALFPR